MVIAVIFVLVLFCMVCYMIVFGVYSFVTNGYHEAYNRVEKYIPLSYDDFMTYYTVDPTRYRLYRYPIYLEREQSITDHAIKFNLWDWKRYDHWRKKKERKEAKINLKNMEHEMTLKYLEMVQNDIDILKRRAEREIDQAIDRAKNISNIISEHNKHL